MFKYFLKRLLLIIPTLIGISLACFTITVMAPGGPIEQKISQLRFAGVETGGTAGGGTGGGTDGGGSDHGVPKELIEALKKQYGFDKPIHIQYLGWLKNAILFDFGESFTYEEPVLDLILERIPISLQFGLVSLFLTYLVCIILGVQMAVRKGTSFDMGASITLIVLYSVPSVMLGILLKVFLAGRLDWFPLGDIYSDMYFEKGFWGRVFDRIHHFILPMLCYMVGAFTLLSQFMKNSLLEEIQKDYVKTARAKGLSNKVVIYKHALRNALVPIATGVGSIFGVFLAGSIIIEQIFNINGVGLLGLNAAISRDYNVIIALIYIQSLVFIAGRIFSDFTYILIDPRIDFK